MKGSGTSQFCTVRAAELSDAERIAEIYRYYVENTAVTFECGAPSADEMRARMEEITSGYPFVVAEAGGRVIGYAYAHLISEREAYRFSVELSIYVDKDCHGLGTGRLLYEVLERLLRDGGFQNMYAVIAYPPADRGTDEYLTLDSPGFHERMGFTTVGHQHLAGYKFGRWYDVIWMEKIIGKHDF